MPAIGLRSSGTSAAVARTVTPRFFWLSRPATAALVLGLLTISPPALAQRSAVSHKSVVVRQLAENQSCASACQTKEAFITIPHAVGDVMKGGIGAREVHGTPIDGVPVFPRKATWSGPNEDDLAREFDQHVQTNVVAYAAAMTTWQSQYGLATATHDLIQRVTHRGIEKRLVVNLLSFDNGNYYYNGARVMPEDPDALAQILYVRAIPSAVTPGLPPAWNWANPGTLQYEERDAAFESGTGFTNVSVGSAYDEPFDYSGTSLDPDARLACLVDKSKPGCGQAQPDVKGLLGTTDATYAVLDYHRRVKPTGVRFGIDYVPQLTARVTDRVATFACPSENSGTYAQVFRYGMRVENQVDRYLVFPDGRHYFIQTFKDVVTPPEASVAGSSAITRNGEYPTLATRFLHHVTNAFTDAAAYAPNTVALDAVTTNNLAPFCGCAPQPSYSENHDCQELNNFWFGTWTRTFTYDAPQCRWTTSDDTSTCVTDWCTNLPGNQAGVPPGMVRIGTTCSCVAPAVWNGTTCEVPPPPVTCSLSQDIAATTPGAPFTLTWGSTNAASAALTTSANASAWGPVPCYSGTLNGSCQPAPVVEGSHLFRFQASGPGGSDTCDVMHTVQCPVGTTWNGATCAAAPPVDVCDNIPGAQSSPPPGTIQIGSSCICTGGRSWNLGTAQCECTGGTTWNGSSCTVPPPVDVCDNIDGLQSFPPPETFQAGSSCLCTGGRTWSNASMQCECPSGTAWNGATCAIATVPLTFSTTGMIFGETLTVSGPGFSADLTSLSEFWPQTVQVPASQSITLTFTPSYNSPFCSGGCVWGLFTTTSNSTCSMSNNQVRFPVSCSFSTGSGGSISIYAPMCVDGSFSATGTCPL